MLAAQTEKLKTEAFRFVLRRETRPEHEALDAHPAFAALIDGTLSLNGYRRLMELFHAYYESYDTPIMEACARFGFGDLGYSYKARAPNLVLDVVALGRTPKPTVDGPAAPYFRSAGSLAGALYVFDGSLLGGSTLHAATVRLLAGAEAQGNGYWQWCRDEGGPRWAMTCLLIEALAAEPQARHDMVEGAGHAFDSFADWLTRWDDRPSGN